MHFILLLVSLFLNISWAQSQSANNSYAVSTFAGPLLPNNIDGITEIQSSWGGRLAKRGEWFDYYELGALVSNSNGVQIIDYFASIKAEVDTPAFITQLYTGLDYFTYEDDQSLKEKVFGLHAGTAVLIHISESSLFRTDMKVNFKPGTTLIINFGLEVRF